MSRPTVTLNESGDVEDHLQSAATEKGHKDSPEDALFDISKAAWAQVMTLSVRHLLVSYPTLSPSLSSESRRYKLDTSGYLHP